MALQGGGGSGPDGIGLAEQAAELLRQEIAPALGLDGEAIEVVTVEDGVAQVRLGAACAGCPATVVSIVTALEYELRKKMPQIAVVEIVA